MICSNGRETIGYPTASPGVHGVTGDVPASLLECIGFCVSTLNFYGDTVHQILFSM